MSTAAARQSTRDLVIGLIRTLKFPVPELLSVASELIEEGHREEAEILTAFLANRAASKDGRLAAAAGEVLSAEGIGAILQIGKAAVHKAKDEGRLLAFRQPGKRFYQFPVFQLEGAAVGAWVPTLIDLVGNGFAAIHFLTVERKSLQGRSFLGQVEQASGPAERAKRIDVMLQHARELRG